MILFRRKNQSQPVISDRMQRRRVFTVLTLVFLIIFSALFLTSKYFNSTTKAAATFNADTMILGENDVMYIGAGGYTSQRFYRDNGSPVNLAEQLSLPSTIPADHKFTYLNVATLANNLCPTRRDGSPTVFQTCAYIVGDGTGMIIHFNQKVQIDGQLYIGDRVVIEAPQIIIGSTGKIYANGQNGSLGYGDDCGAGGIGGVIGGSSSFDGTTLEFPPAHGEIVNGELLIDCHLGPGTQGAAGQQLLGPLAGEVASYFTVDGTAVTGGSAGNSSLPIDGSAGATYLGLSSAVGVGGAGPAGPTGSTHSKDHGSSGGGGGGFGIVFKANEFLKIDISSIITAKGGSSLVAAEGPNNGAPQSGGAEEATGGYGGPGGGGVIIIDTTQINFVTGSVATRPDYGIFNVQPGIFDNTDELNTRQQPGEASRGVLSIKQSGFSKISKQVSPMNVNPGDIVTVTLTIPADQGGTFTVEDEVLNDGSPSNPKYFSIVSLPTGCNSTDSNHKISCSVNTSPIIYTLKAPIN